MTADLRSGTEPDASPPPADDLGESDLFDGDEVWNRPRRTNRTTWILVAALVAVLAFAGGVLVQKGHDAALVSGAARARAAGAGGVGGAAGGRGGGGAAAGSDQAGAGGSGAGQGSGGQGSAGSGGATDAAPVAVGTVTAVSGQTLTLTDFGGTAITVHVPPAATVTTPGLGGVTVGATASVTGTKAADGSVTAATVTVRAASG